MAGETMGNATLDAILNDGAYLVLSGFGAQNQLWEKTRNSIHEAVARLRDDRSAERIRGAGLRSLHEVLPATEIGALRDLVMGRIRSDLLSFTCSVGRSVLGIDSEFFVDDYTILRVNYPYLVARNAPASAENPGIGRVAPQTRQESAANRVVDPVYDPKGFHNHEPPAAWAHGPHQDTWTGHSRGGVNLWWALEDVPEECSMVFYPETFGKPFAPDPRSLYLAEGQPLPKPTKMSMRAGDLLIFNPELLHGTHLNTSQWTRLALSTRINARAPRFSSSCFYAREFWHSSADIEEGRFDAIVRFRRDENLTDDAGVEPPCIAGPRLIEVTSTAANGWTRLCGANEIRRDEKVLVRIAGEEDILVMRGDVEWRATQARCAHLPVSLADGYHDDHTIWCPTHAVAFSLESGRSSCAELTLRTYDVREEGGSLWLRPKNSPRASAPVRRRKLTVNILTKNSEHRLERMVSGIASVADEVLIGVDADSTDRTMDVARRLADVTYGFRHAGQLAAARMLVFEYATGEWILSLDDDEEMDNAYDEIVAELMGDSSAAGYLFRRKWIVSEDPWEYVDADPWYPNWAARMFRNDRSVVWKPPQPHSGYRVQGQMYFEPRTNILHYEPLWCSDEERRRKVEGYHRSGSLGRAEECYTGGYKGPRRPVEPRSVRAPRAAAGVSPEPVIHDARETAFPWKCEIVSVKLPDAVRAGSRLLVEVTARNTGAVVWTPFYRGTSTQLNIAYHILDAAGKTLVWDGTRTPVMARVGLGECGSFLVVFDAPEAPGDYLIDWDMVSEFECWFVQNGGTTLRRELRVF